MQLENHNIFLQQLKAKSIKLVNIGGEDLWSGDRKLILGLTWTLILRYEIHQFGRNEAELLSWARDAVGEYGVDLSGGWSEGFSSGQAFCAIVHEAEPAALEPTAAEASDRPEGDRPEEDRQEVDRQVEARRRQWAAFASGVAARLGEEEQAERSRRRQWAAAAAQVEQERSLLLNGLTGEVERWAAREQRRLQPLQAHVWRALRSLAKDAQSLWPCARKGSNLGLALL